MAIKSILKEELQNSVRMKKNYERELKKLPRGSLVKKKIKGNDYYYILFRKDGKIQFIYKGKTVSENLIEKYKRAKDLRAKYRTLLSRLKKEIKFLKGSLRGKEQI